MGDFPLFEYSATSFSGSTKVFFEKYNFAKNNPTFHIIDQRFRDQFPDVDHECAIFVEASEQAKMFDAVQKTILQLMKAKVTKQHKVIAIGGGSIQDLAGFVSSIYQRGISWAYCPTTLASQADSCVGSKTSINVGPYKNLAGTFWSPDEIYIDTSYLNGLSKNHILCGLGEILHYKFLEGQSSLDEIERYCNRAVKKDFDLEYLIEKTLAYKLSVIKVDERDKGIRRLFNFGHTFGHAIEASTNFEIHHGIAVLIGMVIAFRVSEHVYACHGQFGETTNILESLFNDVRLPSMSREVFLTALQKDKKNTVEDHITCILSEGYGAMRLETIPIGTLVQNLETLVPECIDLI